MKQPPVDAGRSLAAISASVVLRLDAAPSRAPAASIGVQFECAGRRGADCNSAGASRSRPRLPPGPRPWLPADAVTSVGRAPLSLGSAMREGGVEGAADLEGVGALLAFELEPDVGAGGPSDSQAERTSGVRRTCGAMRRRASEHGYHRNGSKTCRVSHPSRSAHSLSRRRQRLVRVIEVRARATVHEERLRARRRRDARGVLIDPGDQVEELLALIAEQRLTIRYILLTHAHLDHITGVGRAREVLGVPIVLHEDDRPLYDAIVQQGIAFGFRLQPQPAPDRYYAPGDVFRFGRYEVRAHHTPGHSPGGVCLEVTEPGSPERTLVVGDTLFAGSIGRTIYRRPPSDADQVDPRRAVPVRG